MVGTWKDLRAELLDGMSKGFRVGFITAAEIWGIIADSKSIELSGCYERSD